MQRVCADLAETFGYEPILTPTFEDSDLFLRTTGESTDIVQKETYTFEDRGGHSLTLRPEGTPGVCRAYLERGLHNSAPARVRLFYIKPMYRFERPQAGSASASSGSSVWRRSATPTLPSTPRSSSWRGACWNRSV